MPLKLAHAPKIQNVPGEVLLTRLAHSTWRTDKKNLPVMKAINGAAEEMDRVGDIGLTLVFKKLRILNDNDAFLTGGTGEVYVVASTLDGTGEVSEFKTQLFEGIDDGDPLPLGDGGMLVCYRKNPRWFLDIHAVVMESDSDSRNLGTAIDEARDKAKLPEIQKMLGALSAFDPTKLSLAFQAVNVFLDVLVFLLKSNGDDHIATIHDFYLKHQAFGQGTHPADGKMKRYQDVEALYQIDLTDLSG